MGLVNASAARGADTLDATRTPPRNEFHSAVADEGRHNIAALGIMSTAFKRRTLEANRRQHRFNAASVARLEQVCQFVRSCELRGRAGGTRWLQSASW